VPIGAVLDAAPIAERARPTQGDLRADPGYKLAASTPKTDKGRRKVALAPVTWMHSAPTARPNSKNACRSARTT
jgi:hypothetical protein